MEHELVLKWVESLLILVSFVLLTWLVQWLMKFYWQQKKALQLNVHQLEVKKQLLPFQMQATERLVLLVERIRPEGLVNRLASGEPNAASLQLSMLSQIRLEVEHNLAQQVYVHPKTWMSVLAARDEAVGLIHRAAAITAPELPAIEFSRNLFKILQEQNFPAHAQAIQSLQHEMRQLHLD